MTSCGCHPTIIEKVPISREIEGEMTRNDAMDEWMEDVHRVSVWRNEMSFIV